MTVQCNKYQQGKCTDKSCPHSEKGHEQVSSCFIACEFFRKAECVEVETSD